MSKVRYVNFRVRKLVYDKLKSKGIIKKRPLFDFSGERICNFYGMPILSAVDGNDKIYDLLTADAPCMIGRIGTVEMGVLNEYIGCKEGIFRGVSANGIEKLCVNAGFFVPDKAVKEKEYIQKWGELYIESCKQLDLVAVFENHAEDFVLHECVPHIPLMQLCALEPYYYEKPWSIALKGKRVLVLHPFAETIKSQYKKRKMIFSEEVLPNFSLDVVKAVQSAARAQTEFEDWFQALNYMKEQVSEKDFDIAIIGCGAYGLPIAAWVKSLGKKAVLMGGATQLLFGIKGARWDNNAVANQFYNQNWVRAAVEETPVNAQLVEGGCYW